MTIIKLTALFFPSCYTPSFYTRSLPPFLSFTVPTFLHSVISPFFFLTSLPSFLASIHPSIYPLFPFFLSRPSPLFLLSPSPRCTINFFSSLFLTSILFLRLSLPPFRPSFVHSFTIYFSLCPFPRFPSLFYTFCSQQILNVIS